MHLMKIVLVSTFYPSRQDGLEIVAGWLANDLSHEGPQCTWFAGDSTAAQPFPA